MASPRRAPDTEGRTIPGDIIVAVDDVAVESVARLLSRLDDHQIGDTVRLTVLRDGRKADVAVKLQAGSQQAQRNQKGRRIWTK